MIGERFISTVMRLIECRTLYVRGLWHTPSSKMIVTGSHVCNHAVPLCITGMSSFTPYTAYHTVSHSLLNCGQSVGSPNPTPNPAANPPLNPPLNPAPIQTTNAALNLTLNQTPNSTLNPTPNPTPCIQERFKENICHPCEGISN